MIPNSRGRPNPRNSKARPLNDAAVSGSGAAAASRLGVVAIRVDDEGGVIVRREVARSWSAIVFRPGRKRRIVKRPNGGSVRARQREMHAGSRFARFANPQARRIAPKSRRAVKGHELLDSERSERLLIEGAHDVELLGAQHDVVEHAMGPLAAVREVLRCCCYGLAPGKHFTWSSPVRP